jgi:hypothetical protein
MHPDNIQMIHWRYVDFEKRWGLYQESGYKSRRASPRTFLSKASDLIGALYSEKGLSKYFTYRSCTSSMNALMDSSFFPSWRSNNLRFPGVKLAEMNLSYTTQGGFVRNSIIRYSKDSTNRLYKKHLKSIDAAQRYCARCPCYKKTLTTQWTESTHI